MSSTSTGTTVLDAAMKVIANEPLIENVMAESELADLFETSNRIMTDQTTGGRYIERAHTFGLPAGYGARDNANDDNIPEADDPAFGNSRIYIKKSYGRLEMQGNVFTRVVGDEGSFLNYAREAFPLFAKRIASEKDRMWCGTGLGIVGRVVSVTNISGTSYSMVMDRAYGVTGYTGVWRQILEGQRLVFSATAAGSSIITGGGAQSVKVTGVDEATDTLTVTIANGTLAAAIVADSYAFNGDEGGTSSQLSGVNREQQGLLAGCDDGTLVATYLNLSRTSNPFRQWKSLVLDTQSATYAWNGVANEDAWVYADEQVKQMTGEKIDAIVMSYSASRGYWKHIKQNRMFTDPRVMASGGGKPAGLSVMVTDRTIPFRVARKLPDQVAFGLTTRTWKKYLNGQLTWDDRTGAIWNRVVTTSGVKDRFYAVCYDEGELACSWPRANIRLDNLISQY